MPTINPMIHKRLNEEFAKYGTDMASSSTDQQTMMCRQENGDIMLYKRAYGHGMYSPRSDLFSPQAYHHYATITPHDGDSDAGSEITIYPDKDTKFELFDVRVTKIQRGDTVYYKWGGHYYMDDLYTTGPVKLHGRGRVLPINNEVKPTPNSSMSKKLNKKIREIRKQFRVKARLGVFDHLYSADKDLRNELATKARAKFEDLLEDRIQSVPFTYMFSEFGLYNAADVFLGKYLLEMDPQNNSEFDIMFAVMYSYTFEHSHIRNTIKDSEVAIEMFEKIIKNKKRVVREEVGAIEFLPV